MISIVFLGILLIDVLSLVESLTMSFDFQTEKPILPSTFTSSNLKQQSPETKTSASDQLQTQPKQSSIGHNLSNIAISGSQAGVQPKLTIGQPGDKYEQEADNVAEQVMSMPAPVQRQENGSEEVQMKPEIQRQEQPEEEEEMQMKPLAGSITPLIQRQEQPEEEEMQMKPEIQRQEAPEEEEEVQAKSNGGIADMEGLETQLGNSKGGGSPLSDEAQSFMSPRFGTDFSDVRVHTDSSAVQMNQSIQAQAFTHGQDIYFNSGKYSPDTSEGKSLLAHELTHVVQQRGGDD